MWVLEGHAYKLLLRHLIEPVSEHPIGAAETFLIGIDGTLIVLVVIGGCGACQMREIRQGVLAAAFSCIDGG